MNGMAQIRFSAILIFLNWVSPKQIDKNSQRRVSESLPIRFM
jgi:hypothetical protein